MASMRHNRNKNRGRRRFGLMFKLLCAGALAAAATLGATVFFQVETIAVVGNSRYTAQEIIDASGVQVGDNLFLLNRGQISAQILQQLPYVGEVTPQRSLPSTLIFQVTEIAAAARIEVYQDPEPKAAQEDAGAEETEQAEEPEEGEESKTPADQPWLISVSGKLLEADKGNSAALTVTGLTLRDPQAGQMMDVPDSQRERLSTLTQLLSLLEESGELGNVSAVDLTHSTWVSLRYRGRFDAKLPLGRDMAHALEVLSAAAENIVLQWGDQAAGTIDLTVAQDLADAIFTPAEG